jgi:predicted Fe-Mo cluster-binding NifX family protein
MRIAFPSKDGEHIWGHPGRAEYIVVVTLEGDKVVQKEVIPNTVKHHHKGEGRLPKEITQNRNRPEKTVIGEEPLQKEKGTPRHKENLWAVLKGVDLFITKSCGEGFKRNLQEIGVPLVITKHKNVEDFIKDYFSEVRK